MKISIKDNGRHIFIPVPNALVFNNFIASIAGKQLQKHGNVPLGQEDLKKLFAAIRRVKRNFGSLVLVEVESKDGEQVKITL